MKPLLLVSTVTRHHSAHSGYQALSRYLPEARTLSMPRAEAAGRLGRIGARVAQRYAFSRWYLGACAVLEAKAWRELQGGFSGIVHLMWADHDLGFLDLLLDSRRHRLVGTFHNCSDTFAKTIRFPRRLRRFDAIILMSRTQEQFFLDAGVDPKRIHVVLHGVATEHFQPATGPAEPTFTVLAAGGYRRNFQLLHEVCARLDGEAGLLFEIIGPEEWRGYFEVLPNARFRSGLTDAEFLEAYHGCSCLLHVVENATANNVILEAMACGKPVVAERIGGIPEYVDASCAILTAPGDAEALCAALLDLRDSPEKRGILAAGARTKAETLNWQKVATQMRSMYDNL